MTIGADFDPCVLRGSTSGSPAIEIVEAAGVDWTGAADAGFACASRAAISFAGSGSALADVEVAGAAGVDASGCGCATVVEFDSAGCDLLLHAASSAEQSKSIANRASAVSGERRKQSSKNRIHGKKLR